MDQEQVPSDQERRAPWSGLDVVLAFVVGGVFAAVLSIATFMAAAAAGLDLSDVLLLAIVMCIAYVGLFLGVQVMVVARRNVSWREIGLRKVAPSKILLMPLLMLALYPLIGIVVLLAEPLLGTGPSAQEQLMIERQRRLSTADGVGLFIAVAIVGPFVEEILFRGLLYRSLRARWRVALAVGISALLFAAAHPIPPLIPSLFVLGAAFALVTERYGSLYPAIALHGINNGVAVVAALALGM